MSEWYMFYKHANGYGGLTFECDYNVNTKQGFEKALAMLKESQPLLKDIAPVTWRKFTPEACASATNAGRDAIALGDKGAFILTAVHGGAKASEASRVYRAIMWQQELGDGTRTGRTQCKTPNVANTAKGINSDGGVHE